MHDLDGGCLGRSADGLRQTGTPADLGAAADADDDLSAEARRGAVAVADEVADLTPDEAEALARLDDDAMRELVGVTDAFFADTWFLASYDLCAGED